MSGLMDSKPADALGIIAYAEFTRVGGSECPK